MNPHGGRGDVARAHPAKVLVSEEAHHDVGSGNAADEVADDYDADQQ
jgi:hypothetical protein